MNNPGAHKFNENNSAELIDKLDKLGEDGFFNFVIDGWSKLPQDKESDLDQQMIEFSESFFALFRRTGERKYFIIGKVFRKVGHVIYRNNVNKFDKPKNYVKFLNLVSTYDEDQDS